MVFGPLPEWQNRFSPIELDLPLKFNILFHRQRMRAEAPIYFTPRDGIPRRSKAAFLIRQVG